MSQSKLFSPLICRYCGNDLVGDNLSIGFFCFNCRKVFIFKKELKELECVIFKSVVEDKKTEFYLPFYLLKGEFEIFTKEEFKKYAFKKARNFEYVFIPAFFFLKSIYSENLTFKLSLNYEKINEDENIRNDVVLPIFLKPVGLERIAIFYYLLYLDKFADITGVKVNFVIRNLKMSLIPAAREDGVKELIFGTKLIGL